MLNDGVLLCFWLYLTQHIIPLFLMEVILLDKRLLHIDSNPFHYYGISTIKTN